MDRTKKLWIILAIVLAGTFTLLGVLGREVYRQAPPIPERVVTESGREIMTKADILRGQRVWQSMGGQQVGSIWGCGSPGAMHFSSSPRWRRCAVSTWSAIRCSWWRGGARMVRHRAQDRLVV